MPYSEDFEVFVAKLNQDGMLVQNTFFGTPSFEDAFGIALDESTQHFYVTGLSDVNWDDALGRGDQVKAFIAQYSESHQAVVPVFFLNISE